jgi:peptidyl-prolyl cis-trans isomerase D
MMQLLRQKTKAIMIVVAASFLIGFIFLQLGVGTGGSRSGAQPRYVGVVNGVEISYNDFQTMQSNLLAQLRQQGKDDLSDEDYDRIEQRTWDELVFQILVQQEIERRGITITDEEVRDFLINNPPDFIQQNENFQVDGQFNREQYMQLLLAPENRAFTESLESYIRQTLPRIKLGNQISLGIQFSDAALEQTYRERMEKVRVGYVFFDPAALDPDPEEPAGTEEILPHTEDPYRPSEEEVRSYYEAHRGDFVDPERAVLQYLEVVAAPTRSDTLDARERAAALVERIRGGEDFAQLASDFTADGATAEQGGDLGFLRRGEMLSVLEEAAFDLEPGAVSDPILSPRGWHIVKLEEKREGERGEEVHVRHILLPVRMSLATRDSVNGLVRKVFEALREGNGSFEEAAAAQGLEPKTTLPFTRTDFIPELGPLVREARGFAFSQRPGAVSRSITRGDRIYVLRVAERSPERDLPLEEARVEIERRLSRQKRIAELKERAVRLIARAETEGGLRAAAEALGLEYRETPAFSRQDFVPGIGRMNAFVGTAHALPKGRIGGPVEAGQGVYVLEVLERQEADMEAFEAAKADLRTELTNRARSGLFERWYASVLEGAEIEDNRLFFGYSG